MKFITKIYKSVQDLSVMQSTWLIEKGFQIELRMLQVNGGGNYEY